MFNSVELHRTTWKVYQDAQLRKVLKTYHLRQLVPANGLDKNGKSQNRRNLASEDLFIDTCHHMRAQRNFVADQVTIRPEVDPRRSHRV